MARKGRNLSALKIVLVVIPVAGLMAGCVNPTERMRKKVVSLPDARLKGILQQSLAVSGGIETWGRLEHIDGQAIATVFEQEDSKALIEQQCQFLPGKKVAVSMTSHEPGGVMTEVLGSKGTAKIYVQGESKSQQESDPETIYASAIKLRVLAHAMMGPAALLGKGLSLQYVGQERQSGRMMHKIEVTGDLLPPVFDNEHTHGDLMVVWIDDQTHRIRRIWLRYLKPNAPFGYLLLDIGNYKEVSGGLTLPRYIAYIHSDRHQQFSQQQIMTIEFQNLQAELRDKARKWFFE